MSSTILFNYINKLSTQIAFLLSIPWAAPFIPFLLLGLLLIVLLILFKTLKALFSPLLNPIQRRRGAAREKAMATADKKAAKVKRALFYLPFFLFSINRIAFSGEIDINKAKELLNKAQYKEALTILSPCLNKDLKIPNQILEECLYLGENASAKMEDAMWRDRVADSERDKIFKRYGIKPEYDHHNGPVYNHDFFNRLKANFPASKYKDEYTYILIKNENWKVWENQLISYLKEFPEGHYAIKAKLDLAHLYDNLWDVLSSEDNFYREYFSSGNLDEDLKRAEDYRSKAINLYEVVLKDATASAPGISEYELKETKTRVRNLRAGVHWNRTWIIDD